MPHSSGGGSHSGGSHSSSSSSSSSSSGGGGESSVRTSKTWFQGSHQYVRYDDNGEPEYIFSSDKHLNEPASKWRFLILIVYLPFVYAIVMLFTTAINIPERLPFKYDTQIYIEDNLNIIEDEYELRRDLNDFLDETGIAVALITDKNEVWKDYYNSMENYAYDMYVTRFPDESHWLITYTTADKDGFDDWYFEGMQGNDTDSILTLRITNIFNENMTKYLMQGESVDRALEKALADIRAKNLMRIHMDPIGLGICLIFLSFISVHAFLMVRDPNKKYRDYALIPDEVKKAEYCEYCGSAYWPGTVLECPDCGAPLKPYK